MKKVFIFTLSGLFISYIGFVLYRKHSGVSASGTLPNDQSGQPRMLSEVEEFEQWKKEQIQNVLNSNAPIPTKQEQENLALALKYADQWKQLRKSQPVKIDKYVPWKKQLNDLDAKMIALGYKYVDYEDKLIQV